MNDNDIHMVCFITPMSPHSLVSTNYYFYISSWTWVLSSAHQFLLPPYLPGFSAALCSSCVTKERPATTPLEKKNSWADFLIKRWFVRKVAFGVQRFKVKVAVFTEYLAGMKVSGIWVLFMVVGTALVVFLNISTSTTSFSVLEVFSHDGENIGMAGTSRKLKEDVYPSTDNNNANNVNLEDYRPIDPVPSSKASIRPGPIQHGTPLMPYIPKPSPPDPGHPKLADSP